MIRAALVLVLMAGPLAAQDLPALFSVTDVAADDVLNIRSEPTAQAEILGEFAPGTTGVEVIKRSENGRWGLVNIDGQTGWSSLRFLTPEPDQSFPPVTYRCFGTEPFWSLDVFEATATWSDFESDADLTVDWSGPAVHPERFGLRAFGPELLLSATMRREICSDGMSDMTYGFSIDAITDRTGGVEPLMVSGCCTLSN